MRCQCHQSQLGLQPHLVRHALDIDIPTQRVPINPQGRCLALQVNLKRVAGAYCFSTNAASALI